QPTGGVEERRILAAGGVRVLAPWCAAALPDLRALRRGEEAAKRLVVGISLIRGTRGARRQSALSSSGHCITVIRSRRSHDHRPSERERDARGAASLAHDGRAAREARAKACRSRRPPPARDGTGQRGGGAAMGSAPQSRERRGGVARSRERNERSAV